MSTLTDFQQKFKLASLTLFTTSHWTVSIRPTQVTVGSLVLSLSRECESLADMTEQESADLKNAISEIERILNTAFSPDKFNYLALMMVDPQVHFHVIPRYSGAIELAGKAYVDKDWPKPANVLNTIELNPQYAWEKLQHLVKRRQ